MIDIFKVGVHIGMTTNSSQILSTMLKELTGIHIAAGKIERSLGAIRTAALGAGAVFAGWMVVKGLIDATKHAENLNHELVKLQTGARLTDGQTAGASNLAFQVSRDVAGTDVAHNVKMQRELFGVFGDMNTAQSLLPLVAQGSRATSNFVDKDTDLAQIAVRALELRGHITKDHKVNADDFAKEFSSMVRAIVASEGLIDPAKLLQFIQQAGPAARLMNGDEFWGKVPAIMNALGSSKAGTATMSLFSQMVGHVVAGQRVAIAMQEAGMLTPGKWQVERGGKVRMDPDATPDTAGFMDHPMTWLHDKLTALRARKGLDGKPIDEVAIMQRIFQFSSRATTARLMSDLDANWPIILNEEQRYNRMPGPAQIAKEQNDKDLSVNINNLHEAWSNFMAALGGPGIPIAITVLHGMTGAINLMQASIIAHPTFAAGMFYLAGGIASLTMLGGGIVLFNIAMGPFVGGIRLLVGIEGLAVAGAGFSTLATGLGALLLRLSPLLGALAFLGGAGGENKEFSDKKNEEFLRNRLAHPDAPWAWPFGDHSHIPNVPWSGKTYGPRSNFVPQSGDKQGSNGPVRVYVENAHDIGRGMSGALAYSANRPQSGPSFQDGRMYLPQPGMA